MLTSISAPDISQLSNIINGHHDEEAQLKLLKDFETSQSLKEFKILSSICELIPLSTSIPTIKRIISAFARRLAMLLDEQVVLKDTELSKNVLECVKSFWSLCSRQQNAVSTTQMFGKWHPLLLEEMTPLASIFIDLFLSAHGHKEDKDLWSRQLYSWLNFDLPDRAIKIALLEAEGHKKEGAELAGPLVSQVLGRKFDNSSNPDYLLHFLLLKKWHGLSALSEITQTSNFIKAPPSFVAWLQNYWSAGNIPDDLKEAAVSKWLLALNTGLVLESLTDALQMAVFPENVEYQPGKTDVADSLLFVVDTKGTEPSMDNDKDEREDNHVNRSPVQSRQMQGSGGGDKSDRNVLKRKRRSSEEDSDGGDDDDDKDNEVELNPKRQKHIDDNDDDSSDEDEKDDDDVDTDDSTVVTRSQKPRNLAAAVLQKKHILITDPVASSYFTSNSKNEKKVMNVSSLSSPIRSSPRLQHIRENSPSTPKAKSTPNKSAKSTPQKSAKSTPQKSAKSTPQKSAKSTPQKSAKSTPQKSAKSTPQKSANSTPQKSAKSTPKKSA